MEIFPQPALALAMTVPFLFTLIALYAILFRPLVAYLNGREDAHVRAHQEAAALSEQVTERIETLNVRLETAHSEVAALHASERAAAMHTEAQILSAARVKADAVVADAVSQITAAQADARKVLHETTAGLSTEIAAQILGREVRA